MRKKKFKIRGVIETLIVTVVLKISKGLSDGINLSRNQPKMDIIGLIKAVPVFDKYTEKIISNVHILSVLLEVDLICIEITFRSSV